MCFVIGLGKYVSVALLSDWLDVESFAQFDASLTNSVHRRTYLAMVAGFHNVFENALFRSSIAVTSGLIVWTQDRGLDFAVSQLKLSNILVEQWRCCLNVKDQLSKILPIALSVDIDTSFDYMDQLNKDALCEILEKLVNVTSLTVTNCFDLATVALKLPACSLESIVIGKIDVYTEDVATLVKRNPSIRELAIHNECEVSTSFFQKLGSRLTSMSFFSRDENAIELLEYCSPGMTRFDSNGVTDACLSHFISNCAHTLTSLCVCGSNNLTEDALRVCLKACRAITDLNISDCDKLRDRAVLAAADCLPRLRSLVALWFSVTTSTVAHLLTECQHLEVLRIDNANVSVYLHEYDFHCPCLTTLELSHGSVTHDAAIDTILERCPRLVDLNVSFHTSDTVLSGLHASGHQLTALNLSNSKFETPAFTTAMLHCPNLRVLNIDRCEGYSSDWLVAVATSCSRLRTLSCRWYYSHKLVRSVAETLVAHLAPTLRELLIDAMPVVLPVAARLVSGLPRLRFLSSGVIPSGIYGRQQLEELGAVLHPNLRIN